MNKFKNILTVLIFSVLSAMAGGYIAAKNVAVNYSNGIVANCSSDITRTVKILYKLRNNNNTEALDDLENLLDLYISSISMFGSGKLDTKTTEALAIAKEYRISYSSHKINEKLRISIERALNISNESKKDVQK